MKNSIEIFEQDGLDLIYYDASYLASNSEFEDFIKYSKEILSKYPPERKFSSITNVEGIFFDTDTKDLVMEWTKYNDRYIKYGVIIGADGIKKIMFNPVFKISGRSMHFCYTKQEAIEWISAQMV